MNYGAPIENLRAAMKDAGLESVDLWIGTGGAAIAALLLPVLRPKAYLPGTGTTSSAPSRRAFPCHTLTQRWSGP